MLAAAICHAGMAALLLGRLSKPRELGASHLGAVTPGAGAAATEEEVLGSSVFVSFVPFSAAAGVWFDDDDGSRDGIGPLPLGLSARPGKGRPMGDWTPLGEGPTPLPEPPPTLLPTSIFKLRSSTPSSFSLPSVVSFWPSRAFGIKSLNPLTSSAIRRFSSSCLLDASFSSDITSSTPRSVVSMRSVRSVSASFSTFVSALN